MGKSMGINWDHQQGLYIETKFTTQKNKFTSMLYKINEK